MEHPPTPEFNAAFRAKALIEMRFVDPPSLAALASATGVSIFKLSRLFGRTFGKPIPTYIRELRIARAIELLDQTNQLVGAVGKEVGYKSISAFSRAYLRETGHNPRDRRRDPQPRA